MATSAGMGSVRCPMVTRSWILTPSYLYHRAEIPHHNIPRSVDPFQVRCSRPGRPQLPPSSATIHPKRPFHTSQRKYSTSSRSTSSKVPHLAVHIAASSSGKGMKYKPEKSTYDYEPGSSKPALGLQNSNDSWSERRRARPDSGQDAYFVAAVGENLDDNITAFGVCDGVGGWSDHSVDPADFSHGLCSYMAKTALEWSADSATSEKSLSPQKLLELGYNQVIKDPDVKAGGSTACVGIVDGDGRMRIANLGDSGFLQLRLGTVHHYSNPQTHAFNTPYQMSLTPPNILAQARIFGGLPLNDLPERADVADHMLRHGDVLVLASDGLWDNLSSQDVLTSVSNTMRKVGAWERTKDRGYIATDKLADLVNKELAVKLDLPGTLQSVLAAGIVGEAKAASLNRKRDGPFAKAWMLHAPYDPYHGGKVDDITVLVLIAVQNGRSSQGLDSGPAMAKL